MRRRAAVFPLLALLCVIGCAAGGTSESGEVSEAEPVASAAPPVPAPGLPRCEESVECGVRAQVELAACVAASGVPELSDARCRTAYANALRDCREAGFCTVEHSCWDTVCDGWLEWVFCPHDCIY